MEEPQVHEDSEVVENSGGLVVVSNGGDEDLEPNEGMAFESEEAARAFYDAYAKHVGFVTRVSSYSRSKLDGAIIARRLVCNKEGFKKGNVKRPLAVTREGCKAMINVKREKPGKWIISKFEKEHSHPLLVTSKARRNCQQNRSSEDAKRIRELTQQLHRANQKCAMYQRHFNTILKDVEEHTSHLSDKVQKIVHNIRQIESEDQQRSKNGQ
ncbi:protein FAR1-RELATED SEQUENCE 5-like [Malania oleifera]|uniref:protein FAR1-RELATED SEQUENCE 5-like n=1 Tax=Malania oleifera TaxID=397392 RepID=UPI0025AE5BAA|nr:protein FAR1-RELATED SEQUENCE 5-like [Malania oleifera]